MLGQLQAAKTEPEAIEKKEGCAQISIDQFMNVELRTAQIKACEPVPRAKKLLKITVDLGYEKRQIVSGIAAFYQPEDLVGKKVIVVANLKSAKLCGVESQGMLLASGEEPGAGRFSRSTDAEWGKGAVNFVMKIFDSHAHYDDNRFQTEYEGGQQAVLSYVFSQGVELNCQRGRRY